MSTPERRAILIDTSSFIHRNFHAMAPVLTTLDEHPVDVGAVKGYVEYLVREYYGPYASLSADIIVHALDSDGSDYRRQLHPAYKANRPPKHPALIAQESMVGRALIGLGEHVLQQRGVEADDLIASAVKRLVVAGYQVCVVTGDKDLMQLVRDEFVMVARYEKPQGEKYNKHVLYQEEEVFKKLNVYPHQVAAFLAMQGDDVDNIPGIANVGKVRAAKLLAEFGSLEALVTRAEEIKGKLGEDFRTAMANGSLDLCYKLTLPLDSVSVDIEALHQKAILNETTAKVWHGALKLASTVPLRLSDFGRTPGYVADASPASNASSGGAQPPAPNRATAPAAAPAPPSVVVAADAGVAPAAPRVATPAPTPAQSIQTDPFASTGEDLFGENLDDLATSLTEAFVSPPPRTAPVTEATTKETTPTEETPDTGTRRRFTRRAR